MTTKSHRLSGAAARRPIHRGVSRGPQIGVRLTAAQYRQIQKIAGDRPGGMSAWIRDVIERACAAAEAVAK